MRQLPPSKRMNLWISIKCPVWMRYLVRFYKQVYLVPFFSRVSFLPDVPGQTPENKLWDLHPPDTLTLDQIYECIDIYKVPSLDEVYLVRFYKQVYSVPFFPRVAFVPDVPGRPLVKKLWDLHPPETLTPDQKYECVDIYKVTSLYEVYGTSLQTSSFGTFFFGCIICTGRTGPTSRE